MKAIAFEKFGGPEVLELMELPEPEPGPNDIKIALHYTSVNPVDWKMREGKLRDRVEHVFPVIPGWDAAGEIVAMGSDVTNFRIGDAVYAYTRKPVVHEGTYAELITVPGPTAAPIPRIEGVGFREAACIPLVGLTAWQTLVEAGRLKKGQKVLIHAGAGGVGSMAIQIARTFECRIYTTASTDNHDYVKELGADVAIDYNTADVARVIQAEEPDGLDLVLDVYGGPAQEQGFILLRPGGIEVSIAHPPDESRAAAHDVRSAYVFVRPSGEQLRELGKLVSAGEIRPPAVATMPLEEAADAHRKSETGHVRGKIALRIRD